MSWDLLLFLPWAFVFYIMHKDNSQIADFNIKFCYGNGTDRLVSVIVEERFHVLTKAMLSKYQN